MTEAIAAVPPSTEGEFDEFPLPSLFEPAAECICDFGDIVLCAKNTRDTLEKFRVSSSILAMHSKPFKALFSRNFLEGQAIAERSSDDPKELELQEPFEALKHLCQLLHNQQPTTDEPGVRVPGLSLSASALLDLAVIADKYDAIVAIRLQIKALLGEFATYQGTHPQICLESLMIAAYLLDQAKHFQHFTQQLILNSVIVGATRSEVERIELLPHNLLSSMTCQQSFARQELSTQVMSLLHDFSKACQIANRKDLVQGLYQS